MNIKLIQTEVDKVGKSTFAKKTDKQLLSYEILSEFHKSKNNGSQPNSLVRYNSRAERQCKLTLDQVAEIIKKYNPHIHGKYLLAKEFGVSPNTIYKVIKKYL